MEIEKKIREDLVKYLRAEDLVDEMLPDCPDLEELWPQLEEAYLPDGVREYTEYPVVSLGWIMFVGMAFAQYWDEDWIKYGPEGAKGLYKRLVDARGYDNLDDYVLEDVLKLDKDKAEKCSMIVGECAARVYRELQTCGIEPGTVEAARAYMAALHQLYLMGIYVHLKALGYHMTPLGS